MRPKLMERCIHLVGVDFIVDMVTLAGAVHQVGLPENSQVLRGGGLADTNMLCDSANTSRIICPGKIFDDFQARGIGQGFKETAQFSYIWHSLWFIILLFA